MKLNDTGKYLSISMKNWKIANKQSDGGGTSQEPSEFMNVCEYKPEQSTQ